MSLFDMVSRKQQESAQPDRAEQVARSKRPAIEEKREPVKLGDDAHERARQAGEILKKNNTSADASPPPKLPGSGQAPAMERSLSSPSPSTTPTRSAGSGPSGPAVGGGGGRSR